MLDLATVAKQRSHMFSMKRTIGKVAMFWMDNHLDKMVEFREKKCRVQPIILKPTESAKFGISLCSNATNEPLVFEAVHFEDPTKKVFLNGQHELNVELEDDINHLKHVIITGSQDESHSSPTNNDGESSAEADDKTDDAPNHMLVFENTAKYSVKIIDLSGTIPSVTLPPGDSKGVPIAVTEGKAIKLEASSEESKEQVLLNGQQKLEVILNSKTSKIEIKVTIPGEEASSKAGEADTKLSGEDSTSTKPSSEEEENSTHKYL